MDDYHLVQRELRAAVQSSLPDLVDTDKYTTWEGMLPVGLIDCPNGLQIVELRCPADLYAEHIALAHCIDSYDQAAYRGDCDCSQYVRLVVRWPLPNWSSGVSMASL